MNGSKSKQIWLFLLSEGGRWTSNEIADALEMNAQTVRTCLGSMTEAGSVKRYCFTIDKSIQFGVVQDSKVPSGVSLADLASVQIDTRPAPRQYEARAV